MSKLLMLTREEFHKIYEQGEEATYTLFLSLVRRIEALEQRLGMNIDDAAVQHIIMWTKRGEKTPLNILYPARIRAAMSTIQKQGRKVLASLQSVFMGVPLSLLSPE